MDFDQPLLHQSGTTAVTTPPTPSPPSPVGNYGSHHYPPLLSSSSSLPPPSPDPAVVLSVRSVESKILASRRIRNTCNSSKLTRSGYFRQSGRRLQRRWENWSGTPSFSMDEPSEHTNLIGVPAGADPKIWFFLIYTTFFISACHICCGIVSIVVGGITTITAVQTVYAHTVSPIWSGLSFIAAGACGVSAARKRTVYMIHLFMGLAVCALFMSLISIQLLRLGLVYHTNDGNTYQRDVKDVWIILALSDAAAEAFFGLIGVFSSWKMARLANVPPEPVKDDGPFHIQITKGGSHYMTTNKYTNKRKISSL